ncbi:MAG: DNA internalization-related competence protein ComEC/Rec2 [Clostridia bacterium]|nr:DNA internalization-related competence protein ComEC/Rec2 [Clostridia bacterium]
MQKQDLPDKKKIIIWLVLLSYFFGAVSFLLQSNGLDKQQEILMGLADQTGMSAFAGKVMDVQVKASESGDRYVQMTVKNKYGKVLVKYYNKNFKVIPGDMVEIQGTVSIPQGRRNPGCFDYALYLRSQNIPVTMTAKTIHKAYSADSFPGKLYKIKESFISRLESSADRDTAAMMRSVMFGEKGNLDEDVLEVFQRNGTAHILAVSGLHIGIIYGFILKLWNLIGNLTKGLICGRRGVTFFAFNSLFFGCYMVMANFSPSVVRAVIMVLLHVFAQLTNRYYDLSNAALTVMIIVLIFNPYMLFNVGFQMSFLAVLTLVLVMPFIKNIYSGVFLSSLVIQIGLGPFIIYNFNYLSLIAVFINVPVIFLAGLIVPAGLVSMVISCISKSSLTIFGISAKALKLMCDFLEWINSAAEIDGVTTFQMPSPPLWIMAFYYLGLLLLATEEGRIAIIRAGELGASAAAKLKSRIRYVIKTCAVILMVSLAFAYIAGDNFRDCNLTFVDVGQGDCMCLQSEGTYLIDGGGNINYDLGKNTLRSYLLKNGMSHVDGAFVTHLHTDHYKGICELCREGMVKKLYVYEGNRAIKEQIAWETGLRSESIEFIHSGQDIIIGDGGLLNRHREYFEVMWPAKKTEQEYREMLKDKENENKMSLVIRVHFEHDPMFGKTEETTMLATGDMGEEGEMELISEFGNNLKSTILKVGHHGSKYSSTESFLDEVDPSVAIIQVGKNNYGHPAAETIDRLAACRAEVYRNDESGAIGFCIKNGKIRKVRRMIE